ncbi:MAG TPA: ATP-binding protein [Anaerolineae bacterium]|nr:ATP-binding protein [Anaerolineae bacterium]
MPTLNFTVDAALLRELGERLVGKPHVALAELIKNSYDADASRVTVEFLPDRDRIEVRDDGHGMDFDEFRDFWMRIGTTHKSRQQKSRYLGRSMTGSKGVGRLAVQLLAERIRIITVPKEDGRGWIEATVDWTKAVRAGELTKAKATYRKLSSSPPFDHGTSILLTSLREPWSAERARDLATEVWWLQPPFRTPLPPSQDDTGRFTITFESTEAEVEEAFHNQMRAVLGIWNARMVGKNVNGQVTLSLEYAGEAPKVYQYQISDFGHAAGEFDEAKNLNGGDFEIRIFHLWHRQPHGIKVGDARDYLAKYGGVHVYDGGFRLPYYGDPKNDWLQIEYDHSHRLHKSQLLPESLQVRAGMEYMPTLGRIFAVVNVDTSEEPGLAIMITRTRLDEESVAFKDLWTMVRYAMDLYANEETRRRFAQKEREQPSASLRFEAVEEVLEQYQSEIPSKVYAAVIGQIQQATEAAVAREEAAKRQMGLLGGLATAGISALAYRHEINRQFASIERIAKDLAAVRTKDRSLAESLTELAQGLSSWLGRARATIGLFDYLADADNVEKRGRFRAEQVVQDVSSQMRFLTTGIQVDTRGVDKRLLLPKASLVEWGAILQNVFANAFNAMVDSDRRLLQVSSRTTGRSHEILLQDTGVGVDLDDAEELFEPFVRRQDISAERRALGLGGSGLGLTIVRLVAEGIGCRVGFVEPEAGFSTAFSIGWRERT